jgi:hypothetical protein
MQKLYTYIYLLLYSSYAFATEGSGHAFANILIFLALAILGYIIFGVKKLFGFIKDRKRSSKKTNASRSSKDISDITFIAIQNYRYKFVDLISSKKILYGALIFYVFFIIAISEFYSAKEGKDFWSEIHFFVFNSKTALIFLFGYLYSLSQIWLINSSFLISRRYGRFQILFPFFLFFLAIFNLIPLPKVGMTFNYETFSESFGNALIIMPCIVIFFNLIQSSFIYIFKSD